MRAPRRRPACARILPFKRATDDAAVGTAHADSRQSGVQTRDIYFRRFRETRTSPTRSNEDEIRRRNLLASVTVGDEHRAWCIAQPSLAVTTREGDRNRTSTLRTFPKQSWLPVKKVPRAFEKKTENSNSLSVVTSQSREFPSEQKISQQLTALSVLKLCPDQRSEREGRIIIVKKRQ